MMTTSRAKNRLTDEEVIFLRDRNTEIILVERWLARLSPRVRALQFSNLVVDDQSRDGISRAIEYAELVVQKNLRGCPNLVLTGQTGTGKTTIAWAVQFYIIERLLEKGIPDSDIRLNTFNFCDLEQRIFDVHRSHDDDEGGLQWNRFPATGKTYCDWDCPPVQSHTRQECIDYLASVSLLVLDEIGLRRATDFSTEILYRIIEGRLQSSRPTIVTTNLPLGKAVDAGYLDARVASRLMGCGAEHIHIKGTDRRLTPEARVLENAKPTLRLDRWKDPDPGRKVGYAKRMEDEERKRQAHLDLCADLESRGLQDKDLKAALDLIGLYHEETGKMPDLAGRTSREVLAILRDQIRELNLEPETPPCVSSRRRDGDPRSGVRLCQSARG